MSYGKNNKHSVVNPFDQPYWRPGFTLKHKRLHQKVSRLQRAPWQAKDFKLTTRRAYSIITLRWSLAYSGKQNGILGVWHESIAVNRIQRVLNELARLRRGEGTA